MNDKMHELVKEVDIGFWNQSIISLNPSIDAEECFTNLVKAIVQECAMVAKIKALSIVAKAGEYAADDDEFDAAKAVAWQFKVFAQEITEHFGVGE